MKVVEQSESRYTPESGSYGLLSFNSGVQQQQQRDQGFKRDGYGSL